ncbi:hypothetical protein FRB95_010049 [Tulasnella sp. JGI-2019a]|nr:hypothetical protein FRB95_010049 [Tulasnella sp. JGI-2019a]
MHSETIQNHVNAYNAAAHTLPHLHPAIDFKTVIHYAFLSEFDLLQDACKDVHEKQWAKPEIWIVIDQYYHLLWAHEEVQHLNIEIQHLQTWMQDDVAHQQSVYHHLINHDTGLPTGTASTDEPSSSIPNSNHLLAAEVLDRFQYCQQVNHHIAASLDAIERLHRFTGLTGCGVSVECTVPGSEASAGEQVDVGSPESEWDSDDKVVGEGVDKFDELLG